MRKLPDGLLNVAGDEPTILIYDDIGPDYFGLISGQLIAAALEEIGPVPSLTVRINSVGGSVFEGTTIYNLLKAHPAQVTTEIDGAALSIASLIALAGDTVRMAENGYYMIHDPLGFTFGNAVDHQKTIDLLATVKESLVGTYAARASAGADQIRQWMTDETWFTAAQALEHGFISEISPNKAVANIAARGPQNWKKPPADWQNRFKPEPAKETQAKDGPAWRHAIAARRLKIDG